jgi:hypothetical protein
VTPFALRIAIKANNAVVDGEERAVQKETAGKKSKRGRLTVEQEDGEYKTYCSGQSRIGTAQDLLGVGDSALSFPGSLPETIKGLRTQTIKTGIFPTSRVLNQ